MWVRPLCHCRRSSGFIIRDIMARKTTPQNLPRNGAAHPAKSGKPNRQTKSGAGPHIRKVRETETLDTGRSRGSVPALCEGQPGAARRARARRSLHAADRRGALGAGDRCRRQQGDARAVRGGRHAGQDGGARRRQGARLHQDHRALSHQGQERDRAVAEAHRRARRRGSAARARRSKRCPASGARPQMSCSISRSASRRSRSTRTSSASATGPGWRPARRRSRSR